MARDYGKVESGFWTGKTGKALKKQGPEAVIVALYLMTCQHANMLGLYYLSKTYIAVDTPLGFEGACKGLQGACEAGFCRYDEESEMVWVLEMASYQIGEKLEPKDNQVKGVQRQYDALPENPFLAQFYERYAKSFHMTSGRGLQPKKQSPSKAPRKPLRSQEHEQEQEQEHEHQQDQEQAQEQKGSTGARAARSPAPTAAVWEAYSDAYEARYHQKPIRNATVNGILAQLVGRLGETAPDVARFYVGHNKAFYVSCQHAVQALLKDAEGLHTQWATGRQTTHAQAVQADRTQANFNAFAPMLAEAEHREPHHAEP